MHGKRPSIRSAALVALVVAAVVVAVGIALAQTGGDADEARPAAASPDAGGGAPAPELAGRDPVTGDEVRLSDFAGTPVVINVWASWCPGCIEEAEDLRRFAADNPDVVVLGIDFQDTEAAAKRFYEQWGWEHPSIFDPDGRLAARLGLVGMPTTYFLSADHRLVTTIVGATDLEGFEQGLAEATRGA